MIKCRAKVLVKMENGNKFGKALLLAAFALALIAAQATAQESPGTLVFALKFAGERLEVQSITLVPGSPPDYKVEPEEDWLSIEFIGENGKARTIRVPDPRKQKLEAFEQNGDITGAYLNEENATLIFAAPNLPEASRAEITDEAGTKLLSVDYRKGIRLDAPGSPATTQTSTKEFEPGQGGKENIAIAAFLGAVALLVAYAATKQNGNSQNDKQENAEEVDDTVKEEQEN